MNGRGPDSIEALEKRLASWKAHIGTRSKFAADAPERVAKLEAIIADRKKNGSA